MAYHLLSVDKNKGMSGWRSQAIAWNPDGTFRTVVSKRPTVGCSMLVGTLYVKSYQPKGYWLTTTVVEILVDEPHYVRFKTLNTEYDWRAD